MDSALKVLQLLDQNVPAIGVEAVAVENLGVEAVAVENLGVEAVAVENLGVEAVAVENLGVEAVAVENLGVEAVAVENLGVEAVAVENLGVEAVAVENLGVEAVAVEVVGVENVAENVAENAPHISFRLAAKPRPHPGPVIDAFLEPIKSPKARPEDLMEGNSPPPLKVEDDPAEEWEDKPHILGAVLADIEWLLTIYSKGGFDGSARTIKKIISKNMVSTETTVRELLVSAALGGTLGGRIRTLEEEVAKFTILFGGSLHQILPLSKEQVSTWGMLE